MAFENRTCFEELRATTSYRLKNARRFTGQVRDLALLLTASVTRAGLMLLNILLLQAEFFGGVEDEHLHADIGGDLG